MSNIASNVIVVGVQHALGHVSGRPGGLTPPVSWFHDFRHPPKKENVTYFRYMKAVAGAMFYSREPRRSPKTRLPFAIATCTVGDFIASVGAHTKDLVGITRNENTHYISGS